MAEVNPLFDRDQHVKPSDRERETGTVHFLPKEHSAMKTGKENNW